MGDEPRNIPRHDPRTEWIADGCAGCITDAAVAIPVGLAAAVIATVTGLPFWAAVAFAALAASVARSLWSRRRRRR